MQHNFESSACTYSGSLRGSFTGNGEFQALGKGPSHVLTGFCLNEQLFLEHALRCRLSSH